jgi:hypothetical protein
MNQDVFLLWTGSAPWWRIRRHLGLDHEWVSERRRKTTAGYSRLALDSIIMCHNGAAYSGSSKNSAHEATMLL